MTEALPSPKSAAMSTPHLTKTFDTSLVDVQRSFSSTETAPSESSLKENLPATQQQEPSGREFRTVTTEELYAQWAQTYDTDNNFLQTVDDAQISAVIPGLLESRPKDSASPLSILDFGCGTGRTTLKLLRACPTDTQISAWDGSAEMIALAQRKCSSLEKSTLASVDFQQVDFSILQKLPSSQAFDILVSTLVLEHISSEVFFTWIFRLLKPGGIAFVSNMHPDMGQNSVAGFDDENQRRIKGRSYLHTVEESVDAARQAGLEVFENDLKVASVTAAMIDSGLVSERGRKWIGKRVLFGFAARRPSNKPESS